MRNFYNTGFNTRSENIAKRDIMAKTSTVTAEHFGYDFIEKKYLPEGKDEYYLRFEQNPDKSRRYRPLSADEILKLEQNGNACTNWSSVSVEDPFHPNLFKNNTFAGLIRIAACENIFLRYHDFTVPAGITNSTVISCDIGTNSAVHYCTYLSHYIVGERVILYRIDEMSTTDHAKFGEGIVKDGEAEAVRITLEPINEAGGRAIFPFCKMIPADAFLWARFREDAALIAKFEAITQQSADTRRGHYGKVGSESVIKSSRVIKDVNFGECIYVKGANKLKNLTVKSTEAEPSQIGEGVELVNGIIGLGSRVFYGAKAVRFVMGNNCELKYGARLIHSVLGDNSTISCCEVLNSLIFPYHEQHHNNSFLIAALIQGQSNMAAGATVGSNHNTRGNDGEIIAGRGFWPGLSSTLKHNCKFASFVLLSKGNYPAELDIPFPFSLVLDNAHENRLEIMPAYYWMHNMYALERNNKKFARRDKRTTKTQHIETAYLAPDTACEILQARELLCRLIGTAWTDAGNPPVPVETVLKTYKEKAKTLFVTAPDVERSKRPAKIIKPVEAYDAYTDMLIWYGITVLTEYFEKHKLTAETCGFNYTGSFDFAWINAGGQLIREKRLEGIFQKIKNGSLADWDAIHAEYDAAFAEYEQDKAENAYAVLCRITENPSISAPLWNSLIEKALHIADYIEEQIFFTKNKDYKNRFRDITYRNSGERTAVLGRVEDNALITESKNDTERYKALFLRSRLKNIQGGIFFNHEF